MGERKQYQPMTRFDTISVLLYRSGIVHSVGVVLYAAFCALLYASGQTDHPALIPSRLTTAFLLFFVSTGVSILFLHLYSRQVLNIIRSFYVIALLILVPFVLLHFSESLFATTASSFIGMAGLGFLLAAFSGIGAKEAFCFQIYEGYYYGSASALLVFLQLGTILYGDPTALAWLKGGMVALISLLTLLFLVKKLRLPLHVDIGDKSRYG